ncbi:N-acetylglucosamine-6-phosphate deacetylase [Microbacterium sp. CnD16-F]|uniref:N-acetylglucosamine-6-phosphate deacetylase n=1 Tax=Microbacterium sp. CnD16-F TaxID=2954493 RepID=UPI0020985495|nr:N-acetylglucosamine-6-phosphate deacetylase [Microbacterium sp. CnD16-F]MCO7202923.1 N-acetylglucosamine-6-phosphate deacetylase [Microbacterium sp. CnD16-F]
MDDLSRIVHSVRLVDGGTETPDAWIHVVAGRVAASGTGDAWRGLDAVEVVDAREVAGDAALLTPGFIDLHGHGGGGRAHEEGRDAILAARALHLAHGTTRAVVSLVAGSPADLQTRLGVIADLAGTDASVLGAHLEGPFLDPGHHGAHDPALLVDPTPDAIEALIAAARGSLVQVTLAPELPGGRDAIARLTRAGVVVAVGHTSADADLARDAFEAGATLLTHAFNAMPGLHHRAPGPVAAATGDPRVTIEVIADGVHVHPDVIRILFAAAPGRIALVTDAMAAAGATDGIYRLGSLSVTVQAGVARLADGTIAGSTLTQDAALRTAVAAGVALPDAVTALTSTPARTIGRPELGSLAVGAVADAVLLDAGLQVRRVFTGTV